ncbi:hypothetical protein V565_139580, partial [Rhizoctonia solani 123E]
MNVAITVLLYFSLVFPVLANTGPFLNVSEIESQLEITGKPASSSNQGRIRTVKRGRIRKAATFESVGCDESEVVHIDTALRLLKERLNTITKTPGSKLSGMRLRRYYTWFGANGEIHLEKVKENLDKTKTYASSVKFNCAV